MQNRKINILIVDDDDVRAGLLESALVEKKFSQVTIINCTGNLKASIEELSPDVVIIDFLSSDKKKLAEMFDVTRSINKPVAMFSKISDESTIRRAIKAGVNAYVFDDLKCENVKAIVEVAVGRFEKYQKVVKERDQALNALADRKVIERAKGILMNEYQFTEENSYKFLRENAMKKNKKIVEIADSIITASTLKLCSN